MAIRIKGKSGRYSIPLDRLSGRRQVVKEPEDDQEGLLSAIQERLRRNLERVRSTDPTEFNLITSPTVKASLARTGEAIKEAIPTFKMPREGSEMLGGLAEKAEGIKKTKIF